MSRLPGLGPDADVTVFSRPLRVRATWRKRDWRWLWLRKRTVTAKVFEGHVLPWPDEWSTDD